jgi:hypothetical protein
MPELLMKFDAHVVFPCRLFFVRHRKCLKNCAFIIGAVGIIILAKSMKERIEKYH